MTNQRTAKLAWVRRSLPGIIALAALGGLAFWGHTHGWKIPRSGTPSGSSGPGGAAHDPNDWCAEHGVPESKCVLCNPELASALGKSPDDPAPTSSAPARSEVEVSLAADRPTGNSAAKKSMAKNTAKCEIERLLVQFIAPEAVVRSGIEVEAAAERPMSRAIATQGEIEYAPSKFARVSSRASGVAWRVLCVPGQAVKRGEILLLVESPEAGRQKAELLQALAAVKARATVLERYRGSAQTGFRTRGELDEAEASLREARLRLQAAITLLSNLGLAGAEEIERRGEAEVESIVRTLGIPGTLAASLAAEPAPAGLIPLLAPLDGVIAERSIVEGEAVEPSRPLITVADVSRLWLRLDVPLEDVAALAIGQEVVFRPEGGGLESAQGRIHWISTALDERTRRLPAAAEIENPSGNLRVHSFGTARMTVESSPGAVAVPDGAVHWEGCCFIVFVREAPTLFRPRRVRLGWKAGGFTQVADGLKAGETIATAGSHVLKSEILRSRLGAGCCDF